MLIRPIRNVILSCVLLSLAAGVCPGLCRGSLQAGQTNRTASPSAAPAKPARKKNGAPKSGAELYKQNCALCHGDDGKGAGPPPANSPFTALPPDLTTLAHRHEGKFPEAYVESVLRSGVKMPDHGPTEMPVWGTLFKAMTKSDEAQVTQRITSLISYLKSIQAK